jgi:hypothetical protein
LHSKQSNGIWNASKTSMIKSVAHAPAAVPKQCFEQLNNGNELRRGRCGLGQRTGGAATRGQVLGTDIERIADEIEDVARSERREFASRMATLLADLLRWQYLPELRSRSWQRMIDARRQVVAAHLREAPSLRSFLTDERWVRATWADAVAKAVVETDLDVFPAACLWPMQAVLDSRFLPR